MHNGNQRPLNSNEDSKEFKGKSIKSTPSSRQSKLKSLKRDIEMKKLILEQEWQEQELAQLEPEMEKKINKLNVLN